jgi:hypothetical protein
MEDSPCALDLPLLRPSPARAHPGLPLPPASRALPRLRKLPARTSQYQEPGTEQVLILKREDANRALPCALAEEPPLARSTRFQSGTDPDCASPNTKLGFGPRVSQRDLNCIFAGRMRERPFVPLFVCTAAEKIGFARTIRLPQRRHCSDSSKPSGETTMSDAGNEKGSALDAPTLALMVEPRGFEPLTSWLPAMRSPS